MVGLGNLFITEVVYHLWRFFLVIGGLARLVYPSTEELDFLSFEPQLFFFLLLPPIIFEAGYSLKKKDFFANFWTISLFAVIGTIISTFIIGFLVYALGLMKFANIDSTSPLEALYINFIQFNIYLNYNDTRMFGSLISAVDPVATLSVSLVTYCYTIWSLH